jgi:hypothetical protein
VVIVSVNGHAYGLDCTQGLIIDTWAEGRVVDYNFCQDHLRSFLRLSRTWWPAYVAALFIGTQSDWQRMV